MLTDINIGDSINIRDMDALLSSFEDVIEHFSKCSLNELDVDFTIRRDSLGRKGYILTITDINTLRNLSIQMEYYRFIAAPAAWDEVDQAIYKFSKDNSEHIMINWFSNPQGMWNMMISLAEDITNMSIEELTFGKMERIAV